MDTKIENKTSQEMDQYIQKRYNEAISYYWGASTTNKRWYKITRSLTVIIGSSVTLTAALASSQIILNDPTLKVIFQFGTPVLAAVLTIVAGFSQSFQCHIHQAVIYQLTTSFQVPPALWATGGLEVVSIKLPLFLPSPRASNPARPDRVRVYIFLQTSETPSESSTTSNAKRVILLFSFVFPNIPCEA